ncbi:glycoside hydrolase family 25 protein [Streptomyces sp. YIM S03343]
MLKGIDVSAYQPATYDVTGLDFVFTKISEGLSYINPRWAQQRDHAKSEGLVWGAYHYPHMANDPRAEADYFLRQVAWQPGDIIVLDWEGYDTANKGVSKARQIAYRDAWLTYVKGKMPGHRVGMYCNTDYWLNVDKTSTCGDFLWIATGDKPAGQPGINYRWTFHQHSTAGGIDHDVAAFTDRAALAAWATGTSSQEDDMTPDQAAQLQALHDNLLSIGSLTEKDAKGNPVVHGAGYYLAHTHYDALKIYALETAQAAAIAKLAGLVGSGVDTATVVAAVQKAIADAVVKVSVDVTGPQG